MKIFYVVVLLTCLQALSSAEDPCFLPAREGTPNWYGNVSTIQNCFRNVPYSETRAANTIARLRQLIDIYAFTDIVKNSGAPWNMQVDLDAGLTTIGGKSYTNDYEFHADVARLFSKLFDAHTVYAFPQPYYNSAIVRPFSVRPENNNGNLRFILQEGLFSTSSFIILTGFDPSPFFGSELTAIDGTPINQWFKNFTDNYVGLYKDPSVRFNAAIQRFGSFNLINGALLSLLDVADSCVMTINGTDVDVPFVALLQGGTNTTDEVIALIDTPATASSKRSAYEKKAVQPDIHRERKQQLSWIEPLLNKDYGSTVPLKKRSDHPDMNNQVQKRDLQADQVILDIKTGNASNFQIIARADDDSMWWGLYTINDSQVIPFVRIVSFAPLNSTSYLETGVSLVNYISSNNIDRLIVDASANGGGNLCLAYATLSIFSQKFRGLSGYERSDLRRTQTNIKLQSGGYMTGNDYRRTSDGTVYGTDNSWFNARTVTRGGQSSQLTQQVFFPSSCLDDMDSIPQTHFPADPIIITDGTCGSSCALFVSKFIEHGVGRVVSYGGYPDGSEMETSSFAGGNIVQWPNLVSRAQSLDIPNPPQYSPTSAGLSFTHHELYIGTTSDLPREFRIQPAPFHTYYYDSFASYDMTTPSGQQAIANLYETAAFAWTFPMPDPPVSPPVTAPVTAPVMAPENTPVRTPVRPPTPRVVSGVTRLFRIELMVAWIALATTLLF